MGIHSQSLFDPHHPIARHHRCRRRGRLGQTDRVLLREHWGGPRALYRGHHHALLGYVSFSEIAFWKYSSWAFFLFFYLIVGERCSVVPVVLLPPEAPGQLSSSWAFYHFARVCGWIDLCIYQW